MMSYTDYTAPVITDVSHSHIKEVVHVDSPQQAVAHWPDVNTSRHGLEHDNHKTTLSAGYAFCGITFNVLMKLSFSQGFRLKKLS